MPSIEAETLAGIPEGSLNYRMTSNHKSLQMMATRVARDTRPIMPF